MGATAIPSRKALDEVGKRHATRLANQPTSLELSSPPRAVARGGEVRGHAHHVTHPSPLGVPSHPADVHIVEATASRSCTLPIVHIVLNITCIEHPSVSTEQELSGHCLGTTSSHDHTSGFFNKTIIYETRPTQSVHVHRTRMSRRGL
jgi:hypothetical protein